MTPILIFSAIAGLASAILMAVGILLLFRRSGHSWLLALPFAVLPAATPFLGIAMAQGYVDLTEFQLVNGVCGLLLSSAVFWLALKKWPSDKLLGPNAAKVFE